MSLHLHLCSMWFPFCYSIFLCPCMSGFRFGVLRLSLPLWLRGTPGPPPGKSPLMPRESLEPSGNSSMAPWTPPAPVSVELSPGAEGRAFSTTAESWQRGILQAFQVSQSLSRLQAFSSGHEGWAGLWRKLGGRGRGQPALKGYSWSRRKSGLLQSCLIRR